MLGNIVSGGDVEEKRTFVSLIADSKKRTEYLDEMLNAEKSFNKAKSEAEKAQGQAKTDLASAQAAAEQVRKDRQSLADQAIETEDGLTALEEAKKALQTEKTAHGAQMKADSNALKLREDDVSKRESHAIQQKRHLDKKAAEIEALETLWAKRREILDKAFA